MINFPQKITAGDSLKLSIPAQDFAGYRYTSADYALKIILRGVGMSVDIHCTADNGGWLANMPPADSQSLTAGVIKWVAIVTKGNAERLTIGSGTAQVEVDLTNVSTYDARTTAQKALADAEKALATFSSSGGKVKKYVIANRQMEFESSADILVAISYWKVRVDNEQGRNRDLLVGFR